MDSVRLVRHDDACAGLEVEEEPKHLDIAPQTLWQVMAGEWRSPWLGGDGSPVVAAALSLVFVGLGQLYLGQWKRSLACVVLCLRDSLS